MKKTKARIIGLCGRAGSGKSTVANMIARRANTQIISIADPMKLAVEGWGLFDAETLWGASEKRAEVHPKYGVTARYVLQTLGAEWGRDMVHEDIWIDSCMHDIRENWLYAKDFVVISDVRFVNEMRAVKFEGGELWYMTRGGLAGHASMHASELDMGSADAFALYDQVIPNLDWAMEQLETHVEKLLGV